MVLPDLLPILPFTRPVSGEVRIPGSKSLTNRALLLAALCPNPVTLTGALFSEDTQLMAAALTQLGFQIKTNAAEKTIRVAGQKTRATVAEADIFVGLAGTAARFLTALCAALPSGQFRIDGVEQMRKRPMKGLIDALRALGASIRCVGEEGFFPLEIRAHGLRGGKVKIDAQESSQLLSALLMAAPLAEGDIEIELIGGVRWPFVQMTSRLMEDFGQPAVTRVSSEQLRVTHGRPYSLSSDTYPIEPDATAASYFLALPIVTAGTLSLPGLRAAGEGLQGDSAFAKVLAKVGLTVSSRGNGLLADFATGAHRRGVTENFSGFSDTFLTLAAIAPLLSSPTKISGIAHTRKQETDRVAGMAKELIKLGQHVLETEDTLEITPRPLRVGVEIETYHDHRFAMSFGILGSYDLQQNGKPWLSIRNPSCCAKTFPDFFALLENVRNRNVAV